MVRDAVLAPLPPPPPPPLLPPPPPPPPSLLLLLLLLLGCRGRAGRAGDERHHCFLGARKPFLSLRCYCLSTPCCRPQSAPSAVRAVPQATVVKARWPESPPGLWQNPIPAHQMALTTSDLCEHGRVHLLCARQAVVASMSGGEAAAAAKVEEPQSTQQT